MLNPSAGSRNFASLSLEIHAIKVSRPYGGRRAPVLLMCALCSWLVLGLHKCYGGLQRLANLTNVCAVCRTETQILELPGAQHSPAARVDLRLLLALHKNCRLQGDPAPQAVNTRESNFARQRTVQLESDSTASTFPLPVRTGQHHQPELLANTQFRISTASPPRALPLIIT